MKKLIILIVMLCNKNILTAQNVGIGTTDPMNKLQVQGNLLVTTPTTATGTAPTAGQIKTMVNAGTISFLSSDSTGRIYDPGGPAGNYSGSQTANTSIATSSNTGIEITAEMMALASGDSLIIKESISGATLQAVGNGYTATGRWVFNSASLYIIFKSNADAIEGAGFSILFRRLYGNNSSLPDLSGFTGNAFYFDVKSGSLRSGALNNSPGGNYSIGLGYYNTASGLYSTALGNNTNASALSSIAMGSNASANGNFAIALGNNATATLLGSTALGDNASATGLRATAIGYSASSTSNYSTAIGHTATAGNFYSIALGHNTSAGGYYSIALGRSAEADADTSLAIGFNTTASGIRSAAIGHFATASGPGSVAIGQRTIASGDSSTAMGYLTKAIGKFSTAMGVRTEATGNYSMAMGNNTDASGTTSTAMGAGTTASGTASTAMGNSTIASGSNSTAMGFSSEATGSASIATGSNSIASGDQSVAMGFSAQATNNSAIALGSNVTASGFNSIALGSHVNTNGYAGAFLIGDNSTITMMNGTTPNNFRARFDGGYRFYTSGDYSTSCALSPGANAWSTSSDVRLKENFETVNGEEFLKKIATMRLVSWNYKKQDPSKFRHYGPMAQEFYAAFGKDRYGNIGNDTTINQADFDGVNLIAIQALEKRTQKIEQLQKENEELKQMLRQMRKELDELKKKNSNPL